MFGYSGKDVGRFMKQVLDSTFSANFGTKISYTGKCHNKTTPNSKKVALSLLKVYNLITGIYIFIHIIKNVFNNIIIIVFLNYVYSNNAFNSELGYFNIY